MYFSRSKNYSFPSEFSRGDTQVLEVKKTHRVLGIQVQDDMRWQAQVNEMVRRATKTTWVLRRMQALGVDQGSLVARGTPTPGSWPGVGGGNHSDAGV